MKRTILFIAALLMLALSTPASAADKNGKVVSIIELHNYFHNGNASLPESPIITTEEAFNEQFGMAAVMGKNGQPTPVNFRRQAVIAIVLPTTSKSTDIDSVSLSVSGKRELTLRYIVHEGTDLGFIIQPMRIYAIPRKYRKYKVNVQPTVRQEVTVGSSTYDVVTLNDRRNNISLSIDYPATGNDALVKSIRMWMAKRLTTLANSFSRQGITGEAYAPTTGKEDAKTFIAVYDRLIADSLQWIIEGNGRRDRNSLQASISRVWESDSFISFEATGYVYTGGAHGESFCDGATFDKATGKRVNLIKGDEVIRKLITERLHKLSDIDGLEFSEEPVPMPKAEPYLDADGKIKFIYQPGEIGAYALGKPSCDFYPYELEKWLTAEGRKLIDF